MKTETKVIHTCEYCKKKRLFMRHAMQRHEKFCSMNPINFKACDLCRFLVETTNEIYFDTWDGEGSRTSKAFKCTKKNILVYPTKVERLGLVEKYPETFEGQEPMPKECKLFIGNWQLPPFATAE